MTNEELVTKIQALAHELISLVEVAEYETNLTEDEKDAIDEALGNVHQLPRD